MTDLNKEFAAITGHLQRRPIGQRIASATVYTLLGGLAVWAGLATAVGIADTVTGV